ncbi:hypothetical protein [Levilactobacillus yonginensis]
MKKLILRVAVVAMALISFGALATVTGHAASYTNHTFKTVPKKLRGTWYHYNKKQRFYQKLVIKRHSYSEKLNKHKTQTIKGKKLVVQMGYEHKKWATYAFEQKNVFGPEPAEYFTYRMKIAGKQRNVLATVTQDRGYAATVYTHSKVKHGYFAPVAVNWRLP